MSQHNVPGMIIPFFHESRFQALKNELAQLEGEVHITHSVTALPPAGDVVSSQSQITAIQNEIGALYLPPDGPDCLHSGFGI